MFRVFEPVHAGFPTSTSIIESCQNPFGAVFISYTDVSAEQRIETF